MIQVVHDILGHALPPGTQIFVFGSRATGKRLKPFSDLDLCLKGKGELPPQLIAAITQAFADSSLPIKVDVVDWAALTPEFQRAISADLTPFPQTIDQP